MAASTCAAASRPGMRIIPICCLKSPWF